MAQLQYIGARYVPVWYHNSVDDTSNWEVNVEYEPLTFVTSLNNHLYLSKKTVPDNIGTPADNTDYWLDMGAFSGGANLQEQIDQIVENMGNLSDLDTTDKSSLVDAINEVFSNSGNKTRKFIFIGDSYQYGGGLAGSGNRWADGWLGVCTTALGLTENVDFYHNEYPGYGFTTNPGFLSLIQNLPTTPTDPDSITDIIVTGGLNDTSGVNSLETPISAFITYCKTAYKNAKVHIGYYGNYFNNPQLRFDGRNVWVHYELYAHKNGAAYIDNSQYLLHDANYYSSDETWHPDQSGHNVLGYKMAGYIQSGNMEAIYDYSGVTFTLSGDFSSMEGTVSLSKTINNDITVIKSQNPIRFKNDNGLSVVGGTEYELGAISPNGVNPAIGGYSEAPVVATFNNYVNGGFEYETWPAKIVYKNNSYGVRGFYLVTNTPITMNVYSVWIPPFDMILNTNLV